MQDLWPDELEIPGLKAPNALLASQASLLGKKTRSRVEAEVVRDDESGWEQGKFFYQFRIVAPLLGGYRYLLFSIVHKVNFYPLDIMLDEDLAKELSNGAKKIAVELEEEFITVVQQIFAAKKTRQVITAIRLQSDDEPMNNVDIPEDIPF